MKRCRASIELFSLEECTGTGTHAPPQHDDVTATALKRRSIDIMTSVWPGGRADSFGHGTVAAPRRSACSSACSMGSGAAAGVTEVAALAAACALSSRCRDVRTHAAIPFLATEAAARPGDAADWSLAQQLARIDLFLAPSPQPTTPDSPSEVFFFPRSPHASADDALALPPAALYANIASSDSTPSSPSSSSPSPSLSAALSAASFAAVALVAPGQCRLDHLGRPLARRVPTLAALLPSTAPLFRPISHIPIAAAACPLLVATSPAASSSAARDDCAGLFIDDAGFFSPIAPHSWSTAHYVMG
jgi:hypothetical protein